jgi:hypothetical protein
VQRLAALAGVHEAALLESGVNVGWNGAGAASSCCARIEAALPTLRPNAALAALQSLALLLLLRRPCARSARCTWRARARACARRSAAQGRGRALPGGGVPNYVNVTA